MERAEELKLILKGVSSQTLSSNDTNSVMYTPIASVASHKNYHSEYSYLYIE